MSTGSGDEERAWAADKRDFVADRRDAVADERDRVADTRDLTADDREAELDEWERQLDARAAELGGPAEASGASAQRAEARAGRSQARQNRDEARAKRTIAAAARDESRKRQADAPPTRLAMVFADIAEQLYDADSFDDVLLRIADAAYRPSPAAGWRASRSVSGASAEPPRPPIRPRRRWIKRSTSHTRVPAWMPSMPQWCTRSRFPTSAGRPWHHGRPSPAYSRPFPTAWPRRAALPPTQAADP